MLSENLTINLENVTSIEFIESHAWDFSENETEYREHFPRVKIHYKDADFIETYYGEEFFNKIKNAINEMIKGGVYANKNK